VERALRGLRYSANPSFGRNDGADSAALGDVTSVALRHPNGTARAAADVDADFEAACERAERAGGPMLVVVLDVSKTGLAAPTADCAARLKQRYGERLTVLVDACQFRLTPSTLRGHLAREFLVAITGSKFLGGPPFSGALLVPRTLAERLRTAPVAWRALECSAREDWPEAYAGRALLPRAFSLGPMLRWWAALEHFARLRRLSQGRLRAFVDGFGAALAARIDEFPATFEAIDPARPARANSLGWDASPTIFPLLLKHEGRPLGPEAVASLYSRLRALAHERHAGQLWIGQPVAVGMADGRPLMAVRLALSAPHLATYAEAPDGCGRLMELADECLWEISRLTSAAVR
jgi:hypothetical protein